MSNNTLETPTHLESEERSYAELCAISRLIRDLPIATGEGWSHASQEVRRVLAERDALRADLANARYVAEEYANEASQLKEDNKTLREKVGCGRPISHRDLLDYEVAASSWWCDRISHRWAQSIVARYFAWKVNRKMARWQKVFARKMRVAVLAKHAEPQS